MPFGTLDALFLANNAWGIVWVGVLLFRAFREEEIGWRFWKRRGYWIGVGVGVLFMAVGVVWCFFVSTILSILLFVANVALIVGWIAHVLLSRVARKKETKWLPWVTGAPMSLIVLVAIGTGCWSAYRFAWESVPRHIYEEAMEEAPSKDVYDIHAWNADAYFNFWAGFLSFHANRQTFDRIRPKDFTRIPYPELYDHGVYARFTNGNGCWINAGGLRLTSPKWWKGPREGVEIWSRIMDMKHGPADSYATYDPATGTVEIYWFEVY